MDILNDMGVSKLLAKVYFKWTTPFKTTKNSNPVSDTKQKLNRKF